MLRTPVSSGVLVRLKPIGKKGSPTTYPNELYEHPLERGDTKSAGYAGGPVNVQADSSARDTVESIFQVRRGESLKKYYFF